MPRPPKEHASLPLSVLATRAALLHHLDGKSNIEIADELGVSRLRVPRLLEYGQESGIVSIAITPPAGFDAERSAALRTKFGLSEALIPANTGEGAGTAIGRLTARYLRELLIGGGRLGVAWGRSLASVVEGAEALGGFPPCDVVQLIGGITALQGSMQSSELLGRLQALTRGNIFALQAPMILPTKTTASGLRAEGSIARTLTAIPTVDVAVVGVGGWDSGTSRVWKELSPTDREHGIGEGIIADVCGIFVDQYGNIIGHELSERMISATADDLWNIPLRVAVARGEEKVRSLDAILRSKLVNVLATDQSTADLLLTQ